MADPGRVDAHVGRYRRSMTPGWKLEPVRKVVLDIAPARFDGPSEELCLVSGMLTSGSSDLLASGSSGLPRRGMTTAKTTAHRTNAPAEARNA